MFMIILNCGTFLVALITLGLVLKTRAEQEKLRRRQKNNDTRQAALLANEFRQTAAFIELKDLLQPVRPLPPLREWAISPDFGLLLARLIDDTKPRVIVEFGGGSSTLVCAYRAAQYPDCHIYSYDHDASFAKLTRKQLKEHGLISYVDVRHAPLSSTPFLDTDGNTIAWYGEAQGEPLDLPDRIDMVVVDGPPSHLDPWARYPSLPALYDRLSPGCVFVLDDADRSEEHRVVARWLKECPEFRMDTPLTEKGAAILTRGLEQQALA